MIVAKSCKQKFVDTSTTHTELLGLYDGLVRILLRLLLVNILGNLSNFCTEWNEMKWNEMKWNEMKWNESEYASRRSVFDHELHCNNF